MGQVLINELIVFDEDRFLLFRADAPEVAPLRLGATTSSCLALLIHSNGAVVRKRQLMAGAWGQYGLKVTDNSLAQSIRQLRLALETLQPGREFIQTLPRLGYKLADGVCTQPLSSADQVQGLEPTPQEIDSVLPADPAPARQEIDSVSMADTATTLSSDEHAQRMDAPLTASHEAGEAGRSSVLARLLSAKHLRGLLLALFLWGIASFYLGSVSRSPSINTDLPVFAPAVTIEGIRIHVPVEDLNTLAAPRLKNLALRGQELAQLLAISSGSANLYLISVYHREHVILCDGELEQVKSRCVGVQL
jgi:DNA-binding winged helix-turn-helix (wHTH) protein